MSKDSSQLTEILSKKDRFIVGTEVSLLEMTYLIGYGGELTSLNHSLINNLYEHYVKFRGRNFRKITTGKVEYNSDKNTLIPDMVVPGNL
ncbi:hypothetical protein HN903_02190 [archaeon]|jgi:hypothetical protein|nr:hypothetical protein [archaeon]MBT7128542.1 hypothetical protein [archaeon]